jgi:hypothetical protein
MHRHVHDHGHSDGHGRDYVYIYGRNNARVDVDAQTVRLTAGVAKSENGLKRNDIEELTAEIA